MLLLGMGHNGANSPSMLWHISNAPVFVGVGVGAALPYGMKPIEVVGDGNALSVVGVPLMVVKTGVTFDIPPDSGKVAQESKGEVITATGIAETAVLQSKGAKTSKLAMVFMASRAAL